MQQGAAGTHASGSVRGQVVQRELTDEARKVLQAAKGNDRDFTSIGGSLDVIDVLQKSKNIRAKHLDEIMRLPRGAAPALESLVQACLVRYFVLRVLGEAQTLGAEKPSTAAIQAIIKAVIAEVSIIKESLRASGYPGAGALTTQLYSMMQASFGALNPAVHGLQHDTSVDPRTLEVCATYVPGRKADYFQRAHSFILYTDKAGGMKFISAHDNGKGILETETGDWTPLKFSDPGLERKVVATGDQAENAFPTMERAAKRINSEKLNYRLIEQNCNSAAHYILTSAGFGETRGPSFMTRKFGWSTALEEQLNRPQRTRGQAVQSLVRPTSSGPVTTAAPAPTGHSSTASTTAVASSSTSAPSPTPSRVGIVVTVTFPLTIGSTLVLADTEVVVLGTDPTTDMVEVVSPAYGVRGFVDAEVLRESTTW